MSDLLTEFPVIHCDFRQMWINTGGFYECPKDNSGNRLGPLVGYAGRYDDGNGNRLQWVGEAFYNFATVEEIPHLTQAFAHDLADKIRRDHKRVDWVMGAPMGGITLAFAVAMELRCRFLYAEKKVVEAETPASREKSELIFGRHAPKTGTTGIVIEDTINNMSTAEQILELIARNGAAAAGFACSMLRTDKTAYENGTTRKPILSVIHSPTPQFQQDDPYVSKDIARGNIVWKPKDKWDELMATQARHKK